MCAGALVSPNVVLTVKHCDAPSGSQVFVGRSDLRNDTEGVVTGLARKIDFPPEGGDLAALILDRSVTQAPIPLGSDDPISAEMSFIPFTVYGYGRTNDATEPKPIIDGRLRSAVGEVTTCGEYRVSKFTFCLTPQKTSAPCQGDSGGPLVASGHLMGLHHTHIIANSHTCYGGTWAATSVPNSEIKKWVDDVIAANPSSS
jgi:trypsin